MNAFSSRFLRYRLCSCGLKYIGDAQLTPSADSNHSSRALASGDRRSAGAAGEPGTSADPSPVGGLREVFMLRIFGSGRLSSLRSAAPMRPSKSQDIPCCASLSSSLAPFAGRVPPFVDTEPAASYRPIAMRRRPPWRQSLEWQPNRLRQATRTLCGFRAFQFVECPSVSVSGFWCRIPSGRSASLRHRKCRRFLPASNGTRHTDVSGSCRTRALYRTATAFSARQRAGIQ